MLDRRRWRLPDFGSGHGLLTIDADDIRTMLSINGLELREGGGVFYLLSEAEERRLDAGELRRVLHTLLDRAEQAQYRFNRRFNLASILARLLRAASLTPPRPASFIRLAEECH